MPDPSSAPSEKDPHMEQKPWTAPSSQPDTPAQEHADTVREALNFGYGGDPNYRPFYEDGITALDALLAEVERLTAAEALAERRLADLRTYWTHCGYPEWYGDEERAWLHAALTDAGPNATQTTERRLGMSEQTPQDEANVILRSLLARFAALQPDNTEEEQT